MPTAPPIEWHLDLDTAIPPDIAEAAVRGVPIVAHLPADAPIDARAAELLEECAAVVRYGAT